MISGIGRNTIPLSPPEFRNPWRTRSFQVPAQAELGRATRLPAGPDHIVFYQKNIEAVCSSEAEVCEQIRRTVIHELGHYFGMDENQLKDV